MRIIYPQNIKLPVLVDDDDYERLNQYNWFINKQGYVARNVKVGDKWTRYTMHREVLSVPKGMDVEHADQNRVNNQKSNLRAATRSENMANVTRRNKDRTLSKYKGVSRLKRDTLKKQWLAYIKVDYKTYYLGYYETQEEAAHMYNQFAEQLFGDYASLNDID